MGCPLPRVLGTLSDATKLKFSDINQQLAELIFLLSYSTDWPDATGWTEVDSGSNVNLSGGVWTFNGSGTLGQNGVYKTTGLARAEGYLEYKFSQAASGSAWATILQLLSTASLPANNTSALGAILGSITSIGLPANTGAGGFSVPSIIAFNTFYTIRLYIKKDFAGAYKAYRVTISGGSFTEETELLDFSNSGTELTDPFYPAIQRQLNSANLFSAKEFRWYSGYATDGPTVEYVHDAGAGKVFDNFDLTNLALPGTVPSTNLKFAYSFDDGVASYSAYLTLAQLNAVGKITGRYRYIRIKSQANSDGATQVYVDKPNSNTATDGIGDFPALAKVMEDATVQGSSGILPRASVLTPDGDFDEAARNNIGNSTAADLREGKYIRIQDEQLDGSMVERTFIAQVYPNIADLTERPNVEITGPGGFGDNQGQVMCFDTAMNIVSWTDTRIVFAFPEDFDVGTGGAGDIVVQQENEGDPEKWATLIEGFIFINKMRVTGITPAGSGVAGGIEAIITGNYLKDDGDSTVTIGGVPATITAQTADSITVVVPEGIEGPADIVITRSDTITFSLVAGFQYYITAAIDAPDTPLNLAATPASSASMLVSWEMAATGGPVDSYELSHDGSTAFETGIKALSFTETDLNPNTAYDYYVRARNEANASAWSLVAQGTTFPAAPGVPANLVATAPDYRSVNLTWGAVAGATGYYVERSLTGTGGWSQIATAATNSYTDEPVDASTHYYYRIRAFNLGGASGYSNTADATTTALDTNKPGKPGDLSASGILTTSFIISWGLSARAITFNVYLNDVLVQSGLAAMLKQFTDKAASTQYKIQVAGVNAYGEGPKSNAYYVTTLSAASAAYTQSENLLPQDEEAAFYRSAHDERVEMLGLPCKLYRFKDVPSSRVYNEFDQEIVTTEQTPPAIDSFVILEPYQEEYDRIGDTRGKQHDTYPFVGTFKFTDELQKQDIVEIDWHYAQTSGRLANYGGDVAQPIETLPTRYKLVNRRISGLKADMVNRFYLAPTEEGTA